MSYDFELRVFTDNWLDHDKNPHTYFFIGGADPQGWHFFRGWLKGTGIPEFVDNLIQAWKTTNADEVIRLMKNFEESGIPVISKCVPDRCYFRKEMKSIVY